MALDFPNDQNPQVGTVYTGTNGVTYTYDGTKWLGSATGGGGGGGNPSQLVNGSYVVDLSAEGVVTFPGNLNISGNGLVATTGSSVRIASEGIGANSFLTWADNYASPTVASAVVVNGSPFGSTGSIILSTGPISGPLAANNWFFDTDGTLSVPGDVIVGAGQFPDAGHIYIDGRLNNSTSIRWVNISPNYNRLIKLYSDDKATMSNQRFEAGMDGDNFYLTTTGDTRGIGNTTATDYTWSFSNTGSFVTPNGGRIGSFDLLTGIELRSDDPNGYAQLSYAGTNYMWVGPEGAFVQTTNFLGSPTQVLLWGFGNTGTMTTPGNIVPDTDNAYDLGSVDKQWRHLYVSTGSIYLGNIKLSNDNGVFKAQTITYITNTATNETTTVVDTSFDLNRVTNINIDGGAASVVYDVVDLAYADGGGASTRFGVNTVVYNGGTSANTAITNSLNGGGA